MLVFGIKECFSRGVVYLQRNEFRGGGFLIQAVKISSIEGSGNPSVFYIF